MCNSLMATANWISGWSESAVCFLDQDEDVAAVFGRLRERNPDRSVYNWLCDQEWDGPRPSPWTGGIVMIRASAFEAVNGYRVDVIAAEDDELCIRMRLKGWRIWRLDREMATHDAGNNPVGPMVAALYSDRLRFEERKIARPLTRALFHLGIVWGPVVGAMAAADLPGDWAIVQALGLERVANLSNPCSAKNCPQARSAARSRADSVFSHSRTRS